MKKSYTSLQDDDLFILTDFSCEPSQELLLRKDLYKILWCKDRMIDVSVDNYELNLKKNQVIFCTPLNVIELPDDTSGLISFVFNKEFFCIQTHDDQVSCNGFLFFGSAQPVIIQLDEPEAGNYATMLGMFQEDLSIKDHLQGEMLRSILKRMLIKSTRMAKTNLPNPNISNNQMNIARNFNILVEKHFREFHSVTDYANLMFKSPKTLANILPKYADKSPLKIINERILLEARRLLLYSDKSTQEIAFELGYKDAGHFSKFFKRHQGMTPSVFRKEKLAAFTSR